MAVAHKALYRTHRPQTFAEVRGQDHVVNVLEEAVKQNKIAHAYLFAGSRGTGKTSVARIFSRSIGCSDKDLYEIDAASNRGIDDIRELREGVHVMPFESPYKVYIIDEAHMLTKDAFNALLKTLEEPPSHAVFILATTERHKVPDTIQSRCESYTFKQPSRRLLADMVRDVAKKERYALEQSAADLVAELADGSFRDALGILQKVLVISKDRRVSLAEVESVTGAPGSGLLDNLVLSLNVGDADGAIASLQMAQQENIDARMLAKLLIYRLRAVLLMRYAKDTRDVFDDEFTEESIKILKDSASDVQSKINAKVLLSILEAHAAMVYSSLPYLPLELAVVELHT